MKNSSLLQQCRLMYKLVQQETEIDETQLPDELKWIERGFGITMQAWLHIEKLTVGYRFMNQHEEISFYKSMKPRFTGMIDYFAILYKSVLFQPEDYSKRGDYWKGEMDSCMEIISRVKKACQNYKEQQPVTDIYFLQQTKHEQLTFGINVNQFDFNKASLSCLLGRLIALKKYKKYIQEKIYNDIPLRQTA
jgi:hypothetical protein